MNRQELEKILDNPPNINDKKIYIWGTGNTASLYQESINRLEQEGCLSITGYADNNSAKWGGNSIINQLSRRRNWPHSPIYAY